MRVVKTKKTAGHVCSVRGCSNRDTVLVARSADGGGGVYLCGECVKAAYGLRFGAKIGRWEGEKDERAEHPDA
ncbi:MAG: hypothetical protein IJ955_03045 [Oscillospiraceae bacterium]|nr:hypothetical protein [Oscillospiraceae bacterium]